MALTVAPEIAADEAAMANLLDPDVPDKESVTPKAFARDPAIQLLDLCAGVGTLSLAALELGIKPTAIDLHPVPVLISKCSLAYPQLYGGTNHKAQGIGTGGTWAGLADELQYWAEILIGNVRSLAAEIWLDNVSVVMCARVTHCPQCGISGPLTVGPEDAVAGHVSNRFVVDRGVACCPNCRATITVRARTVPEWMPTSLVDMNGQHDLTTLSEISRLLVSQQYPTAVQPLLDLPWAIGRAGPITHRVALTPRQALIQEYMRRAHRTIREELAERGYSPHHIVALSTYLALALSDQLNYLCTGASWHHGRIQPALTRPDWMARIEFAEAGAVVLERLWWRRIGAMSATITDRLRLSGRGTVSAGDMTQLPLADNSVDVVVWDPPFYDNIDYDLLAAPWTAFLRVVIGELHPQLPWPDVRLSPDWHPSEFDKAAYENSLVEAASEVARVCRPGGRCGVFWISRSADELQRFIDLVQPHGMELLQTASLRTEVGARQDSDRPTTYVLVFAVARQSHPPRGSQVRAGRLLELGSSGQQSLNAGIAEILERNWVAEDIGAHFSRQVDGNLSQRLAEYVASLPDPTELLRELGTKVLREEAVRLAIGRSDLNGLDALGIARRIMECLGFTVPSAPYFSIGSALQQAEQAHSRIVFGASIEEVKGSGLAACEQIEHVLRFCVTAWTSRAGGDAWETLVEEAYEGQTYPGVGRLSFGDWTALVTTIVRKLSKENQQFERVRRQFKSRGLTEALQGAVWSRNRLAHTEPGRDWAELKRMAASKIGQALKVLRILIDGGALPIVLQPVEEIRDRFSRYRVRLLDHNERQVELIAPGPIDLTEPVIWFTAGLPREVEPDLLSATVVEIRMGLRPDI